MAKKSNQANVQQTKENLEIDPNDSCCWADFVHDPEQRSEVIVHIENSRAELLYRVKMVNNLPANISAGGVNLTLNVSNRCHDVLVTSGGPLTVYASGPVHIQYQFLAVLRQG